ncbi:DivIVA domain-containing protein [Aerococcaceae bacterium DSM 111020]|nr:DivIVA domain-containing protein [Aerococcaceae bacterium DSM 111020]
MALTPNDIVHKEFDTKFRGYDTDQVNDYLDVIVARFEELIQENNRLTQELSAAVDKNEYFAQLQDSLNSSIVVAQEAADRLKQNARKEAELIIFEAEREANNHVNEANEHAQSLIQEVNQLKKQNQHYRQRVENLVREQLALITSDEYQELFSEDKSMQDIEMPDIRSTQSVSEQVDRLVRESEGTSSADTAQTTYAPEETVVAEESVAAEEVTAPQEPQHQSFDETMVFKPTDTNEAKETETSASESTQQGFDFSQFDEKPEDRTVQDKQESNNDKDNKDKEPKKVQSESVLGETIRIELPIQE